MRGLEGCRRAHARWLLGGRTRGGEAEADLLVVCGLGFSSLEEEEEVLSRVGRGDPIGVGGRGD